MQANGGNAQQHRDSALPHGAPMQVSSGSAGVASLELEGGLDDRDHAQIELAERLEDAVREFLRADPARRWLVPRSYRVLIDKLRHRPHRRAQRALRERMNL